MPIFVRYERHLAHPSVHQSSARTVSTSGGGMEASNDVEAQHLLAQEDSSPEHRAMAVGGVIARSGRSSSGDHRGARAEASTAATATHNVTADAEAAPPYAGPPPNPPTDEFGPPKLDMTAPPPYSECDDQQANNIEDTDDSEVMEPPSYEEVERIKAVEAQLETGDTILLPPHTVGTMSALSPGTAAACEAGLADARQPEEDLLGTDFLFFLAFAAAFFFNWVGFVVLVCFCHSVAGRSGALAGFGLSLSKWAVIVRHSSTLAPEANTWLLWLIMVLGLVICLRAMLQYLNAKREWQNASQASRHRFLLFH